MTGPAAPLDDAGLLAAMRQLHDALSRMDERAAARLGLARNDLRCLVMLAEVLPLAPRTIGAGLDLTSGSVTALLDRLERQGLVRRKPDPADRRGVLVAATPKAAARLAETYAPLAEALGKLAGRYGPERAGAAAKHLSDLARITDWVTARLAGGAG